MVPSFKKLPGVSMTPESEYFNKKLAKIRIRTEHCIGLIKGHFQYSRGIRIRISKGRHLRRILRLFASGLVVHNLLVEEPLPPDLEDDVEAERLRAAIHNRTSGDAEYCICGEGGERRDQLFHYLLRNDGRF
jgi:hypothetical protein